MGARHAGPGAGFAGDDHSATVTRSREWTAYEVTAQVPGNADVIWFGITLTGPGRVALRSPELIRTD